MNPQAGTSIFSIDQVPPQIYYTIDKMKSGEFSKPVPAQESGKKGYRIIQLLSKTEPHKADIINDYSKIQMAAMQAKQAEMIKKWIDDCIGKTYVKIDDEFKSCVFTNDWTN